MINYNCYVYSYTLITGNLLALDYSNNLQWAASVLPLYDGTNSNIFLTSSQKGWIANINYLGIALSAALPFILIPRYGLKNLMIIATIPKIFSWLILGLGQKYWHFVIGAVLGGIGNGLSGLNITVYISEIVNKNIRGQLLIMVNVINNSGATLINLLSGWLKPSTVSFIAVVIPIVFLLNSFWLPSSPKYLLMKNEEDKARKVLIFLGEREIKERLIELRQELDVDVTSNWLTWIKVLKRSNVLRSFYLMAVFHLSVFQMEVNGLYQFYTFEESGLNANTFIMITTICVVIIIALCSGCVKYTGKRRITITSLLLLFSSNLLMAVYYTVQCSGIEDTSGYKLIPSVLMILLSILVAILHTTVSCCTTEIIPYDAKPLACLYSVMLSAILNAIAIKLHQVKSNQVRQVFKLFFFYK